MMANKLQGIRCAVTGCTNYSNMPGRNDLSLFRFPKNDKIRKVWIKKCNRHVKFNPNSSRICSDHFEKNQFIRDLKGELTGYYSNRRLVPGSMPTLKLDSLAITPRPEGSNASQLGMQEEIDFENRRDILNISLEPIQFEEREEKSEPNINYKELYEHLLNNHRQIITELEKYKKEAKQAKKELNIFKKKFQSKVNDEVQKALGQFLTKNQIKMLTKKKKYIHWSAEETARAFCIRYLSRRAYTYLRTELKYPLPGLSSLRRWASNFPMDQGILIDVIKLMAIASKTMLPHELLTVIQFDEMQVSQTLEYDKKRDVLIGEHSHMQVVMARGMIGNWKQPIYVGFDTKMTKTILTEIASRLKEANYTVVACVSDCGGGNIGLWNELDISEEKPYFSLSNMDQKIFYFPDAPHLLKLIRNWFLDRGFILENGSHITKEPIEEIISIKKTLEITAAHKLTEMHISCSNTQRQNVLLATQLLSHTTATALEHYKCRLSAQPKLVEETSKFIETINSWFDIMNSRCPKIHLQPFKSAYGLDEYYNIQSDHLENVKQLIKTMRPIGKNSLQLFQKGIIMSINSIQGLFIELKQKYNIKYIMTSKVNQDSLENLFSQLRTRGGLDDHPTPLNSLYRLRVVILGKAHKAVQAGLNTLSEHIEEDFLLSNILKTADVDADPDPLDKEIIISSSSSSSSSDNSPTKNTQYLAHELNEDGLEYLAGWIAHKHSNDFPMLGQFTSKLKPSEHNYTIPDWVQHLSIGGLTKPNPCFLDQVRKMEKVFLKRYKADLPRCLSIVKKTASKISEKVKDLDIKIITTFAKQRIFIRMKYLRRKSIARKRSIRCQSSKIAKKIARLQ